MNYYNIFGIILSQFGFTYGSIASFANAGKFNSYFGYGLWIIGILILFYEEKKEQ